MTNAVGTRQITLTRVYNASPELLFALWTEAEHIARWWGPDDYSAPHVVSDPWPGGELTIVMAGNGTEEVMRATYQVVEAPRRIVVESVVAGPDGAPVIESSHDVTLTAGERGTEVTVVARASVFMEAALVALDGMLAGWRQSLQCLDDVVTGAVDRLVLVTGLCTAPPSTVFARWSRVEQLGRWWLPEGTTSDPGLTITYLERVPDERVVYELDEPGGRCTAMATLDEMVGNTVVSLRLVFDSAEARARAEEAGTSGRAQGALGRLAALVETAGTPST